MKSLHELSTTTRVYGIKPPDERWLQMKAIYDSCVGAGVAVPDEVIEFFDGEDPDPAGVVVDLTRGQNVVQVWSGGPDSMQEGVEVQVGLIPADVTVIRFVNSY